MFVHNTPLIPLIPPTPNLQQVLQHAEPGLQVPCVSAPPTPPVQPGLQAPQQTAKPAEQVVHLNWSHLKSEFSGKLHKDTEANLLCTNDWMNAHYFIECIKVQRFCLTLLGEDILWYHSLESINVD